jgi:hypothetical protein
MHKSKAWSAQTKSIKGKATVSLVGGANPAGIGDGVPAVHNFQSHLQASGIE